MTVLIHRDLTDRLFDALQERDISRTVEEIDDALDSNLADYADREGFRGAMHVEMGDRHWHSIEEDVFASLGIDYDEVVTVCA